MKRKKQFSIMKQKSYLTAGVITLAAVIAMAGIYYKDKSGKQETEKEAIVMAENEKVEENSDNNTPDTNASGESKGAGETAAETNGTADGEGSDKKGTDQGIGQSGETAQSADQADSQKDTKDVETAANVSEPELHFSAADSIGWPINGDVVLNYSMDKSVYFATLDQYKYNPAVVIQGEVNDKVVAAADGQVISVDTSAETGLTVTMGLGSGYQAVYGQLKEVELSPGDYVTRGDTIGFISEPTKYYSVEGSNLYFELMKDGNPVNPMDYLE